METTAACDARCGNRGCAHAGDDAHLERGGVARLGQGLLVGSGSGLSLLTLGLFAVRTRSLVGSGSTGTVGVTVLGAGLGVTAGDGAVAILGLGSLVGIREVLVVLGGCGVVGLSLIHGGGSGVGIGGLLGIQRLLLGGDRILVVTQGLFVGGLRGGTLALLHVNHGYGILEGLLSLDQGGLGIGKLALELSGLVMRGIEFIRALVVGGLLLVCGSLRLVADAGGILNARLQALILGGSIGKDLVRLELSLIQLLEIAGMVQGIIQRIGRILGGLVGCGLGVSRVRSARPSGGSGLSQGSSLCQSARRGSRY